LDSLSTELWIALLTFGTAAVGAIRWLIYVYWKQAEKIEDLRSQNEKRVIIELKTALEELRKEMRQLQAEIKIVANKLLQTQGALEKSSESTRNLAGLVNTYIDTSNKRFDQFQSKIIELGQGLVMVKGDGSKKN
jgi:predicted  nucleic acid-binding Zn-ribbon protein